MTNQELDRAIPEADRKNSLAPVTYIIKLHGRRRLRHMREAVRIYIGDAIR